MLITRSGETASVYLTHTTVISNENSNIYTLNLNSTSNSYVYLYNSIVGNPTDQNCDNNSTGDHFFIASYTLSDDSSCLTNGMNGNIVADPQEEPLQDNGGETMTHALSPDSPAVNQISFGTNGCGTAYTKDQRGAERYSANCDMGAYELDYCTAVSTYGVGDEASLNWVIGCYNTAVSGSKVISLTTDIALMTNTTTIENPNDIPLQIEGNNLTMDGSDQARVLRIAGSEVTIADLTITNGRAEGENGAGVHLSGGSVFTLINSTVSNNVAGSGAGIYFSNSSGRIEQTMISGNDAIGFGGGGVLARDNSQVEMIDTAIFSNTAVDVAGGIRTTVGAIITLTKSTVAYNQATNEAGGLNANLNSTINLINSTVSGNQAGSTGGGIYARGAMNMSYTTIASNTAATGSGIYATGVSPVVLEKVLLAYNSGNDCGGSLTDSGANLASDASCSFGSGLNSVDPLLQPLADNGGETQTHALNSGSLAIDQVPTSDVACNAGVTADQRGAVRADGVNRGGSACDIGAYEHASTETPTAVFLDRSIAGNGLIGLAETLLSTILLVVGTAWVTLRRKRSKYGRRSC